MIIIPAIDIIDGQCVRLRQGDYGEKTVYSTDPVSVAQQWQSMGAELIHLVDLDGARHGSPCNLDAVAQIAASVAVKVELGGGIRSREDVDQVLSAGVDRVILGTAALDNIPLLQQLVQEFGDRIIVGIDARDGKVAVKGWLETSTTSAADLARKMKDIGIEEIIYTDISRDGMLQGPNLTALETIASVGLKTVASGGVCSVEDIRSLRALEASGVYAVIVGKALYTGSLQLDEAIQVGKGEIV